MDEVATFVKGSGFSKADLTDSGRGIILYGRLYTDYRMIYDSASTYVSASADGVTSEAGDILVPASGESAEDIAVASVVSVRGLLLGGDLNVIRVRERLESLFVALALSHGKAHRILAGRAQGKSVVHLHNSDLKEVVLATPTIGEQKCIGEFFKTLDDLIAAHERKLELLRLKKRYYLQQIFSRKLRFRGFTEPWQQRKLGEIGMTYPGLSGKTRDDFGHGKASYVTYLNVYSNSIADIKGVDLVEIDNRQHQVKVGDVFFTTSSETPSEVGMSSVWMADSQNVYLNSFCFGYRFSIEVKPLFSVYLFRSPFMRRAMRTLAQGISRFNISSKKVMEIVLDFPQVQEQEYIGNFLKTLDDLLVKQENKRELLTSMKMAYSQILFI